MHWARVVPTEPDRIIATVARQRVILVRLLLFLVAPASPIVAALRRHDTGCTSYAALRRTTPTISEPILSVLPTGHKLHDLFAARCDVVLQIDIFAGCQFRVRVPPTDPFVPIALRYSRNDVSEVKQDRRETGFWEDRWRRHMTRGGECF
jgi:hypothetical protein